MKRPLFIIRVAPRKSHWKSRFFWVKNTLKRGAHPECRWCASRAEMARAPIGRRCAPRFYTFILLKINVLHGQFARLAEEGAGRLVRWRGGWRQREKSHGWKTKKIQRNVFSERAECVIFVCGHGTVSERTESRGMAAGFRYNEKHQLPYR